MTHPDPTPPAADPTRIPSVMLRVGIIVGTPLLVLAVLAIRPRSVDLLVHNGHDVPIRFAIDGDALGESASRLGPHETLRLTLTHAGHHQLNSVVEDPSGARVGQVSANLSAEFAQTRSTYLWDVGRALGRVWIVHRSYGTASAPPSERLALDEVTQIPAEILPRLDEAFPEQIREKKGQTGGVRSVLWTDHHADSILPRRALVCLDNRSQADMQLWLGDRLLGTSPGLQVLGLRVPAGEHRLRAVEVGAGSTVISEHEVTVDFDVAPLAPIPGFVWCPVGEPLEYRILSRSYGDYPDEVPALETFTPPDRFFPLPAGLVAGLDAFPAKVDVPKGEQGAMRRALFTPHGALTPDARHSMEGLTDELLQRVLEAAPKGLTGPR